MRAITRYVVIEFFKVFMMALVGLTIFMFLVVGAREAVRHGLGPGPILRILPFILPESMRFSIPSAALLAACITYGRMASDNEFIAIKALGISPMAMMSPVIILAFLISLFAVWINDLSVSWGLPGKRQTVIESIEEIVYGMLRTKRTFKNDRVVIIVKRVDGRRLIMPTITFLGDDETDRVVVTAREAELRRNSDDNTLSVFLTDCSIDSAEIEGAAAGVYERVIPLGEGDDIHGASASDLALRDLRPESVEQGYYIDHLQSSLAAEAAYHMLSGDLVGLSDRRWKQLSKKLASAQYRLNRLHTEPWRRWANGFSCFFFVMVGAPLSIRLRNSDFVTSFFLSFLPILVAYYPAMAYGVDRAKEGALPQCAVWTGNLICLLWGGWLIRKVVKR